MSKFSGRCDLFDWISGEKRTPSPQNPNILISDEMECFELFKKRTNGVIHQKQKVILDKNNVGFFLEDEKYGLDYEDGIYFYNREEFKTLKSLNTYGFYMDFEIKFDNLLDIIPYYPYIVVLGYNNPDDEKIYIDSESEINKMEKNFLACGQKAMSSFYRKTLQQHYIEVVNKYFKR